MKKIFMFLAALGFAGSTYAQTTTGMPQLNDEEYAYVTMDLQGILNLTMTSDPTVNFSFKSIADYQNGITKFNATRLDVDATVAWDLFAYANTNEWVQVESYSSTGNNALPAEILEIQTARANSITAPAHFNGDFFSLKGLDNSGMSTGSPTAATQFLAGMVGTGPAGSYEPGSAAAKPLTNQFRLHYRLLPGIPATFPKSTVILDPIKGTFAQAGYYYLEVVYTLVEDI